MEYNANMNEALFENLAGKKPDFAAAAQGNPAELVSLCCVFLLLFFSRRQDEFIEKVGQLSDDEQFVFVSILNEHCGMDILPQEIVNSTDTNPFESTEGNVGLGNGYAEKNEDVELFENPLLKTVAIENESKKTPDGSDCEDLDKFKCNEFNKQVTEKDSINELSSDSCRAVNNKSIAPNSELTLQVKALNDEKQNLMLRLKEQKNEISTLTMQLNNSSCLIQDLKEQLKKRERKDDDNTRIISQKSIQIAEKESIIENSHQLLDSSEKQIVSLEEKVHKLQTENESLKKQTVLVEELKKQIKIIQEKNFLMDDKLALIDLSNNKECELQLENEKYKQELTILRSSNSEYKAEIDILTESVKTMTNDVNCLSKRNEEMNLLLKAYEDRLETTKSTCVSPTESTPSLYFEHQIELLRSENAQLKTELSQKTVEATETATVDEDLSFVIETLQKTIQEKDSEISRLQECYLQFQESVKREQRLIMSAWYDLGVQNQKKLFFKQPIIDSPKENNLNSSWIQQQRNHVDLLLLKNR